MLKVLEDMYRLSNTFLENQVTVLVPCEIAFSVRSLYPG